MKRLGVLIILLLSLVSCKERVLRNALAGPKEIQSYSCLKSDANGNFTVVVEKADKRGKMLLWDNASDAYNAVTYSHPKLPIGFEDAGVGGNSTTRKPIAWYADWVEKETMTFFTEEEGKFTVEQTYKLDMKGKNLVLSTIFLGTGDTLVKEEFMLVPIEE
ncbi:MAG: hypothetical protein L6Q78_09610 [Bacteroidia bacterium]|nr:hypothetical protein [Bacteroidia bacterium]